MSRPGPGSARRPRTVVGQWLVAAATEQRELRDQLLAQLPAGPVRRDELAVWEVAAERATRRYFGREYDVHVVTEFAVWMRGAGDGFGMTLMEHEAVLRAALGEADVDVAGIAADAAGKVQALAFALIAHLLGWEEPVVAELAAKAEMTALKRGWKPVLAGPASHPRLGQRGARGRPAPAPAAGMNAPREQPRPGPPAVPAPVTDEAGNDGDPRGGPADAVTALRAAVISGTNLAEAVRQAMYQNPALTVVLYTESVRRWFGPGCDIRDVTRFTVRIKATQPAAGLAGYRPRDAELMIRIALGENVLMQALDLDKLAAPEIVTAVLAGLLAERQPSPAEFDAFLAQAQAMIDTVSARKQEVVTYFRQLAPQLPPDFWTFAMTYPLPAGHDDGKPQP